MIHVHIESPSVEALQGELAALLSGITKGTVKDVVLAVPHAEMSFAPVAADPTEAARAEIKMPEAAQAEMPETAAPDEAEMPETAEDEEKQPSMTDTRAALNKLRAKKGPKAMKAILQAHGVESFVDLDSAHYAAVVAEAEEALNG